MFEIHKGHHIPDFQLNLQLPYQKPYHHNNYLIYIW